MGPCHAVTEVSNTHPGANLNGEGFPIPAGYKQTCITGPGATSSSGTCPVLTDCAGNRYWAYSDIGNGRSMLIVKYASDGTILTSIPLSGDRYIYDITLDDTNQLAVFWGQYDDGVSLSYAALGLVVA